MATRLEAIEAEAGLMAAQTKNPDKLWLCRLIRELLDHAHEQEKVILAQCANLGELRREWDTTLKNLADAQGDIAEERKESERLREIITSFEHGCLMSRDQGRECRWGTKGCIVNHAGARGLPLNEEEQTDGESTEDGGQEKRGHEATTHEAGADRAS